MNSLIKRFFSEMFQTAGGQFSTKRVVAVVSLAIMIVAFFADLIFNATSTQYIFEGFLVLTLGSLGITAVEPFANRSTKTTAITKVSADVNVNDGTE